MLTSKEVLERTGISRATLNNYIASGLIPRPDVQPPGPEHGAAPRIGYFPDGTVERIEQIQRFKRQGWAMARIAAHFSGRPDSAPSVPAAYEVAAGAGPAAPDRPAIAPPQSAGSPLAAPGRSPAHPLKTPAGLAHPPLPSRSAPAPILTPVAVLVSTLQGASDLWLHLPAGEYFELVNEIWIELDRIFASHGGRHGRHPGEGMVCHFLPQPSGNHLWNALSAALQAREVMRQVSSRWQARKGWDIELFMNTGVDEGQEWLGPLRLAEPIELTVVGGAADHAAQLSRSARAGAIWITRNLIGKLAPDERRRVGFGVPRPSPDHRPLLSSFARLEELAGLQTPPAAIPAGLAQLAVTELLELRDAPAAASKPTREGAA